MANESFYKIGTDVYQTGNEKPIDEATFKQKGINFNLLKEGAGNALGLDQVMDTETKAARGLSSTPGALIVDAKGVGDELKAVADFDALVSDIKGSLSSRDKLVADVATLMTPTEEEKMIQSRILQLDQEQKERTEKVLERGPILRNAAAREISNIQGGFTPESLVNLRQRTNELQKLTLLETQRSNAFDAMKFKLDQGTATTDDLFSLAGLQQSKIGILREMSKDLTTNAKTTLTTILDNFKGLRLNDLSPESAQQLSKVAQSIGIPLDVLRGGMDTMASQIEFDNMVKLYNAQKTSGVTVQPITIDGGTSGTSLTFQPGRKLSATEQTKVNTLLQGVSLINQAKELYDAAVGSEYSGVGSGILARLKGFGRITGSAVGTNQAWKQYQNFLDSNRAPIAKGIKGEVGNLTEIEQKNALKALPGATSSPAEAATAFKVLQQQITDGLSTYGKVNIGDGLDGTDTNLLDSLSPEQRKELEDLDLI